MSDRPWYSNHGEKDSCIYKRDFYDAWAEAAANPVWQTSIKYIACGGVHDENKFHALSGVHVKESTIMGAYTMAKQWGNNGYVYVRGQGV